MGVETNLSNNASRKFEKYRYLLHDLESNYRHVKFVNLSISSLGIFGQSCNSFIQMCTDLSINTGHTRYIITKLINFYFSLFTFSSSCYNYVLFCLLEISVIHPAEYKLPSIREICICMLVCAYENEVLKKFFFNHDINSVKQKS